MVLGRTQRLMPAPVPVLVLVLAFVPACAPVFPVDNVADEDDAGAVEVVADVGGGNCS